jgi:23S rRNA (adenine2503-C2)-methyltransferase
MNNIPLSFRETLQLHYSLERAKVHQALISKDETRKWLLSFEDANQVETVWIPEPTRGTLCISSQVGCTLNCKFCHTGTQPLVRNLKAGEIVAQVLHAKDVLQDWPSHAPTRKIHNIVLMGMGEPLLNYEQVAKAIQIMMHPTGLHISKKKITLSTSGIVPGIKRCAEELAVNLAISLHAVTDELRNYLVPINKQYPLQELLEACKNYASMTGHRKITFEYVMLKDVNDSPADAKKLIELIKGIPAKINLIPFNLWPGTEFECSTEAHIKQFAAIIEKAGYIAPVRTPRGQDIMAACGQLKSASMKAKAYQV